MRMDFSQQMQMRQQMKMAPRMIQSMEILQLPHFELQERIEQELVENVALEAGAEPDADAQEFEPGSATATGEFVAEPVKPVEQRELTNGEDNNASDFERLMEISEEWPEDNYTSGTKPSSNRVEESEDRQHDLMSNAETRPQTLQDYLIEQFSFFDLVPRVRHFGEYLIQNLDHNGRLHSTLAEVVQVYGDPVSMEEAEQALRLIQKLDPPGVGARDLRECLLLQVSAATPMREVVTTLISAHLEDLAENRLPIIERATGYSIDTIKEALAQIRKLNPAPGRGFEFAPAQRVTPDLAVDQDENGKWTVRLLDEYIPQLRINKRCIELFKQETDPKSKEFLRRKIESAKFLIDSIEQRYNTLKRVAQAIVNVQQEFLDKGPEYLAPLKMQQIADEVGVHVTTVSRAVDDKYLATPRGIVSLRRFFAGGTQTADGEEVAWNIVRLKLKDLVDREDKKNPLSDDEIVEEMAKLGYTLARRTVTKYRQALDIPSSRQRRQY